jgi:hypothetical protein
MILSEPDAALFYRAWGALLTWVNDERHVVAHFPRPAPEHPIEPDVAAKVRDVVWAEDALRERFLAEGASDLSAAERDLVASWKDRIHGKFVIFNHLKKHSIFMGDEVYAVRGIYTPLAAMFPDVPVFVEAVLIPFRDVIITDGLVLGYPMRITFGGGARRMFKEQYRAARAAGQVQSSLPARADAVAAVAAPPTGPRPARRRTRTARSRSRRPTTSSAGRGYRRCATRGSRS